MLLWVDPVGGKGLSFLRHTLEYPIKRQGTPFSAIGYEYRLYNTPRQNQPLGGGTPKRLEGRPPGRPKPMGEASRCADFGGVRPLCYKGGSLAA
jgi:hypothetical protein